MFHFLQDRLDVGLSPFRGSARGYTQDSFYDSNRYYKFLVMSFELANASKTFMNLMNGNFKSFFYSSVIVIIDYTLVYSKSKEVHTGHLRIILEILKEK